MAAKRRVSLEEIQRELATLHGSTELTQLAERIAELRSSVASKPDEKLWERIARQAESESSDDEKAKGK